MTGEQILTTAYAAVHQRARFYCVQGSSTAQYNPLFRIYDSRHRLENLLPRAEYPNYARPFTFALLINNQKQSREVENC